MKAANKIEMYDSGVILNNGPVSQGFEFVGWDYGGESVGYEMTLTGLALLEAIGSLSKESQIAFEDRLNLVLFQKTMPRWVTCSLLRAEELPNGNLKIDAVATHSHEAQHDGEEWHISATYKGNYTVFWADE